jgi:chaperonin GroES
MPLIPFKNRVTIYPLSDPETSAGGIFIPDIAKTRNDQGIVAAVGDEVKDVKPGDYVIYSAYAGTLIIMEGTKYIIMTESDLVARIDETFENQVIPGLFFRGREEYFGATYSQVLMLIAQHMHNDRLHDALSRSIRHVEHQIIKEPINVH